MEDSRPDDTCDETHNESVQIDISNVKLEFLKVTGNKADADSDYKSVIYRVFFFILIQELACCELILGLLRSQIGSIGPQDWAQITFR